ncbi:ABC transporter ATP-binding protein [Corynebacterium kutscheri]|uniref:HMP/thiamine import ATP-binding protein n=1 Tax=Corynebacterium kutscheri TaxID=35755 RepID=A0AB38VU67_9CORY|nr:ATP-binding cassette domain-containing protein [Corynebacterium kutscheri]VEH09016.1 HMP/thiamine import ATP-binding protein [Corynebacterium kutscheri]
MQITARNFGYRHASRKNPALTQISFSVEKGERILLLGASGSGKSTLMAALAGVLGAEDGQSSGELIINTRCGMVLQDPDSQVIASRVGDDVAFGCENFAIEPAEIWRRVPQALALVGLDLPLDHPTAELSGGQKQRLALAGVIAMGAELILLDEPTANIDSESVPEIVHAVTTSIKETGASMIIVEHRVDIWRDYIDRVIVLKQGRIIADGTPDNVLAEHGNQLVEEGIWVPGITPELPAAKNASDISHSDSALTTRQLVVGWDQPHYGPVEIAIPRGVSTVITGVNGVGKSTLALTLAGLKKPYSGSVHISQDIAGLLSSDPYTWRSKDLVERIGYVFQDPEHQFMARSVQEELLVSKTRRRWWRSELPSPEDIAYADEVLNRLGLIELAKANPFTLSGGQKRRLSVATCLVAAPDIVFFDEPTFGQDRKTFVELINLIRQLSDNGTTVVSISHDPLYLTALGDLEIRL